MAALLCLLLLAAGSAAAARTGPGRQRQLLQGSTGGGGGWGEVNGQSVYFNPRQSLQYCNDVAPDNRYSCQQQKDFGACDEAFMTRGNYCSSTCGRCFPGGRVITVGNVTFYRNPNQRNATGCTDVPPDTRYSCAQQRDFGQCSSIPVIRNGSYCARTCGLPPCPPVALNVTAANATTLPATLAPNATTLPATLALPGTLVANATNATAVPEEVAPAEPGLQPVLTPVPAGNESLAAVTNQTAPLTVPAAPAVAATPAAVLPVAPVATPPLTTAAATAPPQATVVPAELAAAPEPELTAGGLTGLPAGVLGVGAAPAEVTGA